MRRNRKISLINLSTYQLLFLVVFTYQLINLSTAFCLDLGFARADGGRPGAFLQYGAGARALGMGKTFVGIADDASAAYWNPAGLAQLRQKEFLAVQSRLYADTEYSFVAGVYPLNSAGSWKLKAESKNENQETSSIQPSAFSDFGTLGVAIVNLTSTGFQLRDEYNYELGEGGVSEAAALVSYAKTFLESSDRVVQWSSGKVSAGVTFKIVNQNIDTRRDTGYGMDAGLLWQAGGGSRPILKPLTVGLSLHNILAPRIKLKNREDVYPLSATLGIGYKTWQDKLLLALDLNKTENRSLKTHFGAEYTIAKILALRAGLDETEAALGLGVKWRNYALDYAFGYHDAWPGQGDLGASHRFGLTVKWGNTKTADKLISVYVDKEKQEEIVAATPQVRVDAQGTGLIEERLKQEIKEQLEKQTGEKVTNVEIEKIEEIAPLDSAAEPAAPLRPELSVYIVKTGDCLWTIAAKAEIYDNPWKWRLIYAANKNRIQNPNLIYPGQVLKIPRRAKK